MADIKAVVSDFDGVWYDIEALPNKDFYRLCDNSCAEAVSSIFPNINYEDAGKIASMSYKKYNNNVDGFLPFAREAGIDESEFKINLHRSYHSRLLMNVLNECPNLVAGSVSLSEKFAESSAFVTHAILSHASVDDWIKPILRFRGDTPYIDDKYIWGMENFGFISKEQSAEPISSIIKAIGYDSSEVMFIEDNIKNIEVAKKAFPDLTTVFVKGASSRADESKVAEFADLVVHNMEEALDKILEIKTPSIKAVL